MNKQELIQWLNKEQAEWLKLVRGIDPLDLEKPGVNGDWSVKDIIAHLTTWHRDHVLCLDAALKGVAPPDPPWPLELENTDEINAWIYSTNRNRSVDEVIQENEKVFQALMGIVERFLEDICIEIREQFRVVEFDERPYSIGYFFDHFHEEHEGQVREWISKLES